MLRIAEVCCSRGHEVHVFTLKWQGEIPDGIHVHVLPVKRLMNYQRYEKFHSLLPAQFQRHRIDGVVGFNRLPGLDVYYAADACFREVLLQKGGFFRRGPRYDHFLKFEHAVFEPEARTELLMISAREIENYRKHYDTPVSRFHLLPPGIARDRMRPVDADSIRAELRREFNIGDDEWLLLMVGSGFRTKGLDRNLQALHAMPEAIRKKTHLMVMGQDNPKAFHKMARRLGVDAQLTIFKGRSDVPRFLLGADLMVHPALFENTGTVLLEALVAGLPVLTTDTCGYAFHIEKSGAGCVVRSPFSQQLMNETLLSMLDREKLARWSDNGVRYGQSEDLYGMPELAADIILDTIESRLAGSVRSSAAE